MTVSLLISTYNRPDTLELCLKSIMNQIQMPDEVLIADDGSTEETRILIESYKLSMKVPIVHVWQEDIGFELAKIRNKAISKSRCEYIVQIDGDLILHPYFIKDHVSFAKPNSFVRASRIYLDENLTKDKIADLNVSIRLFDKGLSNFMSNIRIPFLRFLFENNYKNKGDEVYEIHGCNMAYWKEDAIKINGYNEDFVGWGPEDKEFIVRLMNAGVKKRFLKLGGIVYHLWHKVNQKENIEENIKIFENAKLNGLIACENGINKYL